MMPQEVTKGQAAGDLTVIAVWVDPTSLISGFVNEKATGDQTSVFPSRSRAWWMERKRVRWLRQPTMSFASEIVTGR
jgi:hypothetical protein